MKIGLVYFVIAPADSELIHFTYSSLHRGYATDGNLTDETRYKPVIDEDVKLQLECISVGTCNVGMVDIKPALDYGVYSKSYLETTVQWRSAPDITDASFYGGAKNFTIKNGTISQGLGNGIRSNGVYLSGSDPTVDNLIINFNGINTDGIRLNYPSNPTVINNTINNTDNYSMYVFNRMHGVGGLYLVGPSGVILVDNNIINNMPQYGIRSDQCLAHGIISSTFNRNTIRDEEKVTEGYGISLGSGGNNFEIANNVIQPNTHGRGILIDSVGCLGVAPGGASAIGGKIHDNQILNLDEVRNVEYDENGLEAVGIRLRNWGSTVMKDVSIYGNTITGSLTASSVHGIYGINATLSNGADSIDVYNNTISVTSPDASKFAADFAFQSARFGKGGYFKIHDNTLSSNNNIFKFGGNDGTDVNNILIDNNTMTILPGSFGKPIAYGFYTSGDKNVVITNSNTGFDVSDGGSYDFSNVYNPVATLSSAIDATQTTLTASGANIVEGNVLMVETEQILVGAVSGNSPVTLSNCTRGYNGTTPASHLSGAAVIKFNSLEIGAHKVTLNNAGVGSMVTLKQGNINIWSGVTDELGSATFYTPSAFFSGKRPSSIIKTTFNDATVFQLTVTATDDATVLYDNANFTASANVVVNVGFHLLAYSIPNFATLVSNWLHVGTVSDLNSDNFVNSKDLGIMMSKWQ